MLLDPQNYELYYFYRENRISYFHDKNNRARNSEDLQFISVQNHCMNASSLGLLELGSS